MAHHAEGEYGSERRGCSPSTNSFSSLNASRRFLTTLRIPPHSARAHKSPRSPSKLPARTLVSQGRRLVVDSKDDHAVDHSFRVGPLLRESLPTDVFHLSFTPAFKGHAPVDPFNRRDRSTSPTSTSHAEGDQGYGYGTCL